MLVRQLWTNPRKTRGALAQNPQSCRVQRGGSAAAKETSDATGGVSLEHDQAHAINLLASQAAREWSAHVLLPKLLYGCELGHGVRSRLTNQAQRWRVGDARLAKVT